MCRNDIQKVLNDPKWPVIDQKKKERKKETHQTEICIALPENRWHFNLTIVTLSTPRDEEKVHVVTF